MGQSPAKSLVRHIDLDLDDLCEEGHRTNRQVLVWSTRTLRIYTTSKGIQLWIISEAVRSSTMILLPEEY